MPAKSSFSQVPTPQLSPKSASNLLPFALRSASAKPTSHRFRSQLKAFEGRYLQRVGILYAELDDIAARITEREVALYDSDSARRRAQEARQRAQETHEAAFGADHEPEEFDPSPSLKTLFRDVANASILTLPVTRQNRSTSPC